MILEVDSKERVPSYRNRQLMEFLWLTDGDNRWRVSAVRGLKSNQFMKIAYWQVMRTLYKKKRSLFNTFSHFWNSADSRTSVICKILNNFTTVSVKEFYMKVASWLLQSSRYSELHNVCKPVRHRNSPACNSTVQRTRSMPNSPCIMQNIQYYTHCVHILQILTVNNST